MQKWKSDDQKQREVRDRILKPHFYDYCFTARGYQFIPGESPEQKNGDTLVIRPSGRRCYIEEKIVEWKDRHYNAVILETDSCTVPGHESPGWMRWGLYDALLYCFRQQHDDHLICSLIDFQHLREWFADNEKTAGWPTHTEPGENRTRSRVVPLPDIFASDVRYLFFSTKDIHERRDDIRTMIDGLSQPWPTTITLAT